MERSIGGSHPVALRVRFKSATRAEFVERYSGDVSRDGVFVRTAKPLEVGTALTFEFRLADDPRTFLRGAGTVRWIRAADMAKPELSPGMGLQFDELPDDSRQVLDEILRSRDARYSLASSGSTRPSEPIAAAVANASQPPAVSGNGPSFDVELEPSVRLRRVTPAARSSLSAGQAALEPPSSSIRAWLLAALAVAVAATVLFLILEM